MVTASNVRVSIPQSGRNVTHQNSETTEHSAIYFQNDAPTSLATPKLQGLKASIEEFSKSSNSSPMADPCGLVERLYAEFTNGNEEVRNQITNWVNTKNGSCETLIYSMISAGRLDLIEALCNMHADLYVSDFKKDGETVLHHAVNVGSSSTNEAAQANSLPIMSFLLSRAPDIASYQTLSPAAWGDELAAHPDHFAHYGDDQTALHRAVQYGNVPMARLLMEAYLQVPAKHQLYLNTLNGTGYTPLMVALGLALEAGKEEDGTLSDKATRMVEIAKGLIEQGSSLVLKCPAGFASSPSCTVLEVILNNPNMFSTLQGLAIAKVHEVALATQEAARHAALIAQEAVAQLQDIEAAIQTIISSLRREAEKTAAEARHIEAVIQAVRRKPANANPDICSIS